MSIEIERKFLVISDEWLTMPFQDQCHIVQAYVTQNVSLAVKFDDVSDSVAFVTLQNAHTVKTIQVTYDPETDAMQDIKKLSAYNPETGHLRLSEQMEARFRLQKDNVNGRVSARLAIKRFNLDNSSLRLEFQASAQPHDGRDMIDIFCDRVVEKTRTSIMFDDRLWEIDYYHGKANGLITADIEVSDETVFKKMKLLAGLGADITDVSGLRNQALAISGVPLEYKRPVPVLALVK